MTNGHEPLLEECIEIAAPPAQVWAVVRDVRRMSEWSPQVESTRLRDAAPDVALGVEFTNLNSQGELQWKTHGTIVRLEPDREMAFRIAENWAVWSFHLEPIALGTKLIERRETPDGLAPAAVQSVESFLGGQVAFSAATRGGMRRTLAAIKATVENEG